jgi:hypothetical protein
MKYFVLSVNVGWRNLGHWTLRCCPLLTHQFMFISQIIPSNGVVQWKLITGHNKELKVLNNTSERSQ